MSERARKRGRLSRSGEFDRVYRDGTSRANRFLVFYSFPRAEAANGEPRLGVSVGRKVGGAVVRNRVKRTLREVFWAQAENLPGAHDFVLVARPGIEELVEREGAAGLERSLTELLSQKSSGEGPGPAEEAPPGQERLT
ncbi:MAG: ribonuclease P protein component [Solirubrobacterales bacterium]